MANAVSPLIRRLLSLALGLALGAPLPAQGPLTPPGAPAPSGRSLDQIEPRIPIPPTATLPYTITQKGSYYLTGNLTVASGNAIVIQANDVSLDLGGFTISSTAASLSGVGVLLDGVLTNVSISNGFIRGSSTYSTGSNTVTGGGFSRAIDSSFAEGSLSATGVRVSSLGVSGVGDGIRLNPTSPSNVVEKSTVTAVQGVGIRAGVVADSSADRTGGVSIEARASSNVAGSRYTSGDALLPLPVAPLTRADVESRTALAGGTSTVTISSPGSYVLTGNIAVASGNGITITADNVTLDLNGFTISSTAAAPAGIGIQLSGGRTNVAIANGHIRGTRVFSAGSFTGGGFNSGIDYSGLPRSARVHNVSVTGVGQWGIDLGTDRSTSVVQCTVRTAGTLGIQAGTISDSCALEIGNAPAIAAATALNVFATLTGVGTAVSVSDPTSLPSQVAAIAGAVDARIGIPGGTSNYTISQPGSYVLRGNLTVTSGDGIQIAADDVTLDLNGFTVTSNTVTPAAGSGVLLVGAISNITIRNGNIRGGATLSGVNTFADVGFAFAISSPTTARNLLIENVSAQTVRRGFEIQLTEGGGATNYSSTVRGSRVTVCADTGIRAAYVFESSATRCGATAITARVATNCLGESVGGTTINVGQATNCQAYCSSSSTAMSAETANGCTAINTGSGGGLSATVANHSYGQCVSGNGLSAQIANGCTGVGTNGFGLVAYSASYCRGVATSGIGLSATLGIACQGVAPSGNPLAVTNRYLMP